jgi:hypothetical protein
MLGAKQAGGVNVLLDPRRGGYKEVNGMQVRQQLRFKLIISKASK